MRGRLRYWLNALPLSDDVERRQARIFQGFLICWILWAAMGFLPLLLGIRTASQATIWGIQIGLSFLHLASLLLWVSPIAALIILRRGFFHRAVAVAVWGVYIANTIALFSLGINNLTTTLIVFQIPLVLAGLLVGRRLLLPLALLIIATATLRFMVSYGLFFAQQGVADIPSTGSMFVIGFFIAVTALVAFLLDGFSAALRDVLTLALERERQLNAIRASLEQTVSERTAALAEERGLLARRVEERTADLSAANAELSRAARLKDEFLASMSHELRTPLNTVLGMAEALQEEIYGPLTQPQRRSMQSIEASGRHLLELINDVLDLAKIEAGKAELALAAVPVASVCQISLQFVQQQAQQKCLTIESAIDPDVQLIRADVRRLKQILINLLSNAVKFTPEGGTIGLEVRGDMAAQQVRFSVWDTGIGIAEADLPHLFKPFVQLDGRLSRQYEGTGLGLALVARMVDLHGGSVSVSSALGKGSRFTFLLPWQDISELKEMVPLAINAPGARPPAMDQALIIDDSPTTAEQLARYLQDLGIVSHIHPHGRDAMARVLDLHPDVILLDLLLPDHSGWSILAELKGDPRTRDIPVLVVSVVDEPARGRELGAGAYLVKPVTRLQLHTTLGMLVPHGAGKSAPTPPPPPRQTAPMVLLAEDNEANITTLSDYLQSKGYHIAVARTGHEAIARALEVMPDVILMDIQMPQMDGLEAIRRIRASEPLARVPIIALTALTMPGDRERCLEIGADAYLSKPVSLKQLTAMLAEQIAGTSSTSV